MKASKKSSSSAIAQCISLTFFEVAEHGTITDPGVTEPKTRSDVFQNVSPGRIRTTDQLISEIESCTPLEGHFSYLADNYLSHIEVELEDDDSWIGLIERRRLAFLAAALRQDPDTGWHDWIKHEGDPGLAGFKEIIQDWLDEHVDWDEAEWFDSGWSVQDAALGFFSDLDAKVLDSLGVVIIMGEHPGSSYYAAELRGDLAQANQVAQELGLAFRFRALGESAPAEQALASAAGDQGAGS